LGERPKTARKRKKVVRNKEGRKRVRGGNVKGARRGMDKVKNPETRIGAVRLKRGTQGRKRQKRCVGKGKKTGRKEEKKESTH